MRVVKRQECTSSGSPWSDVAAGLEPLLMPQVKDVAAEAKHRFAMLMEDVFGNYVVQKLLERAAAEDKKWMAERICRDNQKPNQPNRAVVLSKHQYGCRVVQKALEVCTR